MSTPRDRIEHVIIGVLRQAFADAGTTAFELIEAGPHAGYAAELCERAGGKHGHGLSVSSASKTTLLLGEAPNADLLPLGDLYVTRLVELAGDQALPAGLAELAAACGGPETLDRVLEQLFDQRRSSRQAFAGLTPAGRELLEARLDAARFRRTRVGLVPKLGARTLGIDLYA